MPGLLLVGQVVGGRGVRGRDGARVGGDQRGDHPVAGVEAQLLADAGTDVAADHRVPLVAEGAHDPVERVGGPDDVPAVARQRGREAEAGDRRHDDVERRTVHRVGQGGRELGELDERRGVPVAQQQRCRVLVAGAHVQPVDRLAVDVGEELRQAVEPLLLGAPVEARAPVLRESSCVGHGGAALPAGREVGGPAGAGEPVGQVVELRGRDRDLVRSDVHGSSVLSVGVVRAVRANRSARRGVLNPGDTQTGSPRPCD